MPTLHFKGAEISYRDEGAGPPVILLHSSSSAGAQWRGLVRTLARDHRVIAVDRQGYGRSAPLSPAIDHLFAHESALVAGLIESAGEPVHLVGHSSGGVVAARAALASCPRVASLTLIEPVLMHLADPAHPGVAALHEIAQQVIAADNAGAAQTAAPAFIDYWNGPGAWEHLPEENRRYIASTMSRVAEEFRTMHRSIWPAAGDLARLTMPVLLMQGARTTAGANAVMERLKAILPFASHVAVAGAGHMAPITHAADVDPMIANFVRAVEAETAAVAA